MAMSWIDWIILAVLVAAALGGLVQGFFRSFCSLAGLIGGLALAAWNYRLVGSFLLPIVKVQAVADTIGFIAIALVVMALANLVGGVLSKTISKMGLGCLDSLLGAVLGFVQGVVLVMIAILVTLAFFPHTRWLTDARTPQYFFEAAHLTTHVGPSELADRVRDSLTILEQESPQWAHPGKGQP